MNQLAAETSPYLLQHKDNPVDWHVWSHETLGKAKAANKPILLSIGYAACHWCHVMARESFENAETAALMNDLFVPVKVDREERPDLDSVYQNALGLLGQSGGWPLTMFLTPDGEPYWGGHLLPAGEQVWPSRIPRRPETLLRRLPPEKGDGGEEHADPAERPFEAVGAAAR
jgi:uncharacterized protein